MKGVTFRNAAAIALPLACLLSITALAQDTTGASTSVAPSPFSRTQIQEALDQGVDLRKVNTTPGLHTVPLSETWSTAEQAEETRKQIEEQRSRGFYTVGPDKVIDRRAAMRSSANQRGYIPRHDRTFRTLTEIKDDLVVRPIDLATSELASATLMEVRLGGNYHHGKWTGVSRTFEVPDLGLVVLDEKDHAASRDSVTVVQEWVNTDVNGNAGTVKTARNKSGRSLVLVGWANRRKLYSLELQPNRPEAIEKNQARLLEIARKLVET